MEWLFGSSIGNVLLILLAVAVGWTILKAVLRLTARIFAMGCLVLAVLVGIGWLISTMG
jgi:hypothetical protein